MPRFQTRRGEVDALQWTGENLSELMAFVNNVVVVQPLGDAQFWSPFGSWHVKPSQWVVKEDGALARRMTDVEFNAKYEPAGDDK